jgi:hypothetical protein
MSARRYDRSDGAAAPDQPDPDLVLPKDSCDWENWRTQEDLNL